MATRATDAMLWLSRAWCAAENAVAGPGTAVESGILPDRDHTSGYHVSRRDNPAGNYSIVRADDRAGCGPDDAAAAIDMTFKRTADLVACYARLSEVWANRSTHPAARFLNAFNGWDGHGSAGRKDLVSGKWSTSDRSHTWHIHIEIRRRYVEDWGAMRALLAVLDPRGADMQQDEKLIVDTGNPGRRVGDTLADLQNLRNLLVGGNGLAELPPDSPLARLTSQIARIEGAVSELLMEWESATTVALTPEDLETIANQVSERTGRRLDALLRAIGSAGEGLATADDEVKP